MPCVGCVNLAYDRAAEQGHCQNQSACCGGAATRWRDSVCNTHVEYDQRPDVFRCGRSSEPGLPTATKQPCSAAWTASAGHSEEPVAVA